MKTNTEIQDLTYSLKIDPNYNTLLLLIIEVST